MSFVNFFAINDYNDIAKGILFAIYEIFWKIVYAIGNLIDVITGLFYKLVGIDYLGSGSETLVEEQDLLSKLFNQNIVSDLFLFMMITAVTLMMVFGAVAVIKQNYFSKEEARSTAGVLKNFALAAILLMCLAPLALFALSTITTITSGLANVFSDNTNTSLADLLFNSSFTGNPIEAYNTINSTEITSWMEMENGFLFALDYGTVETGVTFNWYVYILGAGIVLYNLIVIVIRLIKRIFNIIILYLTGPLYVARMVDDGGVKFKEWKNKIFPELMHVVGTVLMFMLVVSFVGVISDMELITVTTIEDPTLGIVSNASDTVLLINNIARILLIVAGVSVAKDAGELLGNVFKSSNEESVSLLEGIFNRLGPKEYKETTETKTSAPRTRVITKSTTSTRRVINYNEVVPSSSMSGGSGNVNVVNNSKNNFNANVQNVDRRISNIENRTNVSISEKGRTNDYGVKTGSYKAVNENTSDKFKASDILSQKLTNDFRKETDSIRSEWGFMKNSNSEQSKQVVKDFETASKDFDSSIKSGEPAKIKDSMTKYVEAYKKEEKVAKEGYKDFAGKSTKLSNDLSAKQQIELRNISNAYRKAQVDYGKTARKLSEVSKGNMSAADALRVKEKADKQREKLMSASSKANEFYNNQKKGV